MSEFTIKKATRQGVIPLIDLYSESGCGKTMSALLLARGIAGPDGEIAMIDTESGRGSLYADVIPGGYGVMALDAPFSPDRYIKALEAVFKSSAKVCVMDSASHEWEGIGGVCDMAGDIEEKSGKGLHCWKTPKLEHAKLVQLLLRSPIPVVCCIRAKYKTRQKKENGKTVIIRDDVTSPIQAEDFIFEATAHAEILPDHSINLTKCSHPELRKCFPEKGPITIEHGALIAKWCGNAGAPSQPTVADTKALKAKLWEILAPVRGTEKSWAVAQQWLVDEALIDPAKTIQDLTPAELSIATTQAQKKLAK